MTWMMPECMDGILIQKVSAVLLLASIFNYFFLLIAYSQIIDFLVIKKTFKILFHFQWNTTGSQ